MMHVPRLYKMHGWAYINAFLNLYIAELHETVSLVDT
jgi:hypothetical protein